MKNRSQIIKKEKKKKKKSNGIGSKLGGYWDFALILQK